MIPPNPCLSSDDREAILIVGCGDIGQRVAAQISIASRGIVGIVRSQQSAETLKLAGITSVQADLDRGDTLPAAALLFWFAPPPDRGDTDSRLRNGLAAIAAPPRRIVYISTSGVYGDCEGRWIDESEALKPQTPRARRRLDAELALADYAQRAGTEIVILRVPGIYGPGRLPITRLQQGLPVVREDQSPYTNRIHADDLAAAAIAAAQRGHTGAAYNISDGNPTTMADYFTRCAHLLGAPPPPQVTLDEARERLTPSMMSFLEESKRLLTRRMREELDFTPKYPNLEAGLPACLNAGSTP